MNNVDLLEKLKLSGITVIDKDNIQGTIIDCLPEYRNNFGFFHIKGDNFEAIILKGIYKDYLRIIKGNPDINSALWDEVVKGLNDAERAVGYASFKIALSGGEARFFGVSKYNKLPNLCGDMRDYQIPRPLSATEYAAAASNLYNEDVILSQKFIGSLFPQTMTPLSVSILEKIPNVLNPIFMSCNLKTDSPSAIPVYARPFTNLNAFEKLLKTISIGNSIFRMSFSPNLYLQKETKPTQINSRYFPIEDLEITEILSELKQNVETINTETFVDDKYIEFHVNFAVIAEFIFVKLCHYTAILSEYFTDISQLLRAVYKTRQNSIFYNNNEVDLPYSLDYNTYFEKIKFSVEKENISIDDFIKKLPFFKKFSSKNKIKKAILETHKYLDLRDELYLLACNFIKKSKEALDKISDFALQKDAITEKNDIYLFEHSEIKSIINNSYIGDTISTINFRKKLYFRYATQIIPTEIYGRDLSDCAKISETMVIKALSVKEYNTLSFFVDKDLEATATNKLDMKDYNNNFITLGYLPIIYLEKFKNTKGFILENMPLFSFVAEYAALNNIPVYSGVRFAPIILDNIKLKGTKNKLTKIDTL